MPTVLPELPYQESPNQSARADTKAPYLIVLHSWGNAPATTPAKARLRFAANLNFMLSPSSEISAHVVYGGCLGDPAGQAVQIVPWHRKAWTEKSFNSVSYSIESADAIWAVKEGVTVYDEAGLKQLARIVGFLCTKTGIPPVWSRDPLHKPGLVRHYDLGLAGGGHTDPTTNRDLWMRFIYMVKAEVKRGDYRPSWGKGTLRHL